MNYKSILSLLTALACIPAHAIELTYSKGVTSFYDYLATVNEDGRVKMTPISSIDMNNLFKDVDSLKRSYSTFSRNGSDSSEEIERRYEMKIDTLSQRLDKLERENENLKSQINNLQNRAK